MPVLRFTFNDHMEIVVDQAEFGKDGIGATIDGMSLRHQGIRKMELEEPLLKSVQEK